MIEATCLGSGSSGNSLLIRTANTILLVDCGIGLRRLSGALATRGLKLDDIDAVLISHEHGDHVRELPRLIAANKTIICTKGSSRAAHVPRANWEESASNRPVKVGDFQITAIPVSHDAVEPCGFLICGGDRTITILTDLGSASAAAAEAISESHLVVLEANHDEALLQRGPYPMHLKRRILSDAGHLSNTDCAELLASALLRSRSLPTLWLAHLSEANNRPALAKQTVTRRLAQAGLKLDLQTLPRRDVSSTWNPLHAKVGVAQLALDIPVGKANA
ncbi:MAG: MBL fold metallo-hydrolase [Chloroflexia bacterium]|nr:MBL fold metallo-hydrolase [Chloroflexia bacterium]